MDSDLDPPVLFACSSDPDNLCEIRDKVGPPSPSIVMQSKST